MLGRNCEAAFKAPSHPREHCNDFAAHGQWRGLQQKKEIPRCSPGSYKEGGCLWTFGEKYSVGLMRVAPRAHNRW